MNKGSFNHLPPYLEQEEINEICRPLTQAAAQIRYLKSLGMIVSRKPGGDPLIAREEFRRATVRQSEAARNLQAAQPNREALRDLFKGKQHGAQA